MQHRPSSTAVKSLIAEQPGELVVSGSNVGDATLGK